MDTVWLSLQGAFDLFKYGLLIGAGLPIIFALGVRFWSGPAAEGDTVAAAPAAGSKVLAWVFFVAAAYLALLGLLIIIGAGMGKIVDLPWPILIPKP